MYTCSKGTSLLKKRCSFNSHIILLLTFCPAVALLLILFLALTKWSAASGDENHVYCALCDVGLLN